MDVFTACLEQLNRAADLIDTSKLTNILSHYPPNQIRPGIQRFTLVI